MRKKGRIYQLAIALLLCFLQMAGIAMYGQDRPRAASKRAQRHQTDTLNTVVNRDSLTVADSLAAENKRKMLEMTASPDLIPGGGQIYNRKYWKLPIFYGGFAGCAYALTWNSKMYKDYSAAYKDAVNGNFNSSTITDLLPPNYNYTESQLTETLRKRKDTFRRYRDLSIFAFIGVYLLSVVDAYVDAELSNFDITPDLSMKVEPAIINSQMTGSSNKNVGVQCSFRF